VLNMAKIKRKGNNRVLVLAWSGKGYKFQESIIDLLTGSSEAADYVMSAIDFYESHKQQGARSPNVSQIITEPPQKQEISSMGVPLTPEQKQATKKKYML